MEYEDCSYSVKSDVPIESRNAFKGKGGSHDLTPSPSGQHESSAAYTIRQFPTCNGTIALKLERGKYIVGSETVPGITRQGYSRVV